MQQCDVVGWGVVDQGVGVGVGRWALLGVVAPFQSFGNLRLGERVQTDEFVALGQHVEGLVVGLGTDRQLVGADLNRRRREQLEEKEKRREEGDGEGKKEKK